MVNDVSKQGRYHKHVRLFLPVEKRDQFMMNVPRGFTVHLYAPQQTDPTQFVDQNEVNITIVVNENEPDPRYRTFRNDIDTYLSSIGDIDNRIRIISDNVTQNDQPNLVQDWFLKNEVLAIHPGFEAEEDNSKMEKVKSKMANVKEVKVTESQLKAMDDMYKNVKKSFIKNRLMKAGVKSSDDEEIRDSGQRDPETNEKIYLVKQGEL